MTTQYVGYPNYKQITIYSSLAAFPAVGLANALGLAADTGNLYEYLSGSWQLLSSAGGSVTTIGTIDSQTPAANGAVIAGTSLYMQSASGTAPGLVNNTTQTLSGVKTFSSTITGSISGNAGTATTSTNLAGGLGGSIPYQSAVGTTTMLANGLVNQFLQSGGGTNPPGWVSIDLPLASNMLDNLGINVTAATGDITINLTDNAGLTPSPVSQVTIGFRDATATNGFFETNTINEARTLSLVGSSTLGVSSGVATYIYVYAFLSGGDITLGASVKFIDEGSLQSSSTTANSSSVIYQPAALSNKGARIIGRFKATNTAGSWGSPTEVSVAPFESNIPINTGTSGQAFLSGGVISPPTWGTLTIGGGGTGQVTKTAAFDALSPMTTGGDIIYGGTSGTGTRLANGSSGQTLISAGGTSAPTWGALGIVGGGTNQATAISVEQLSFAGSLGITGAASAVILKFDTVDYSALSGYDTGTGLFTAPVTGNYCFQACVTTTAPIAWVIGDNFYIYLYKNGSTYRTLGRITLTAAVAAVVSVRGSITLRLAANDTIGVYVFSDQSVTINTGVSQEWLSIFQVR